MSTGARGARERQDLPTCALVDDCVSYYQPIRFCIVSRFGFTLVTSFPQLSEEGHDFEAWRAYVG